MWRTATWTSNRMDKLVKKLEIKNKLGLHARAAAALVQTVNKFSAQVTFTKDGQTADGRSIMGILTLAAPQGSKVQVEASGEDAEQALRAIERLIDRKFNEPE
jgi:phosphocarrier protein